MENKPSATEIEAMVANVKSWLESYKQDLIEVKAALLSQVPSPRGQQALAGILNYQIRKMDLTPDWTPEIGMVDDTMVLRTGAIVFKANSAVDLPPALNETIERLAAQDQTVRKLLGEDLYDSFYERVRALLERRIHGRTPEQILEDPKTRQEFIQEVDRFIERYTIPSIAEPQAFHLELLNYLRDKLD